ncbi:hypothetical protein COV12_02075 [Candidatus Woesearchaeota archaeon CG10_big_fil_rev_8_21_14_0_10_32_24]|nr:MAG: hypothetical protein COV12_02075 [Candidatus Woesearchaeota archaeon CG10_big_fil_rev_8_21_14_0_10_32_24]
MRLFKDKKGFLDDMMDFIFMTVLLVLGLILIGGVLYFNVSDNKDVTMEKINFVDTTRTHLFFLNTATNLNGVQTTMQDLILYAFNKNNPNLFEAKTKGFFNKYDLEGAVEVYNAQDYIQKKDYKMSFSNRFISSGETESVLQLVNPTNKNVPLITVVFKKNE